MKTARSPEPQRTPSMHAKPFMSILMLALCAAGSLPALAGQQGNSASPALLETASLQLEFGEVGQAEDTLERALRIEPNNPATLHSLGQVRFQQGQYTQAVALAMRSNARARGNAELRSRNQQLIQAARQAMGPGVATAEAADVEVDEQAEVQVGLGQAVDRRDAAGIAAADEGDAGSLRAASLAVPPADDEVPVPRGQMPPPGKCRIWYPERPAARQPAPAKCKKLQGRVPQGAYLLRG